MKAVTQTVSFCVLFLIVFGSPLLAAGPVDGEVGAIWWSNDMETESGTFNGSSDSSTPGLRAELWMFERYGVRASQYSSDTDGLDTGDVNCTTVDVMWRAFAPTKNNFLAVGLGWQQTDLGGVGINGDTSGPRLSLEGRFGFMDTVYAYGLGSYAPSLNDASSVDLGEGQLDDIDGHEYELGVGWNVAPFVSVRAGYRASALGFTQTMLQTAGTTAAGRGRTSEPVIGLGGGGSDPSDEIGTSLATASGSTESAGFFVGAAFRF